MNKLSGRVKVKAWLGAKVDAVLWGMVEGSQSKGEGGEGYLLTDVIG